MKKLGLLFLLLISFQYVAAQNQNVSRQVRGSRGYVPPPKYNRGTYIELKNVQEETELILAKCEKEFNLDAFQKEILKSMLTKKLEAENAILEDKGNTREDRRKKIIDLNNNFFIELSSIFTTEQINHYKIMDFSEEDEKIKKKKKKKKKKNKDKTH